MFDNNCYTNTPIFIIAGEVSGDIFASELMVELQKQISCSFFGFGGLHMKKHGLISLSDDNSLLSAIGFLEAGRFLLKHFSILQKIIPQIKKHNIKHIILVDHEVFNILAAKRIRKAFGNSVKIYFYIPPRVSMWGIKQAPVVAKLCDALFCYMLPDLKIYQRYNPHTFFYGNPLAKKLKSFIHNPDFFYKHNLDHHKEYISLMPGSRKQEIEILLPIFLKTAVQLHYENGIEFIMSIAHNGLQQKIREEIHKSGITHAIHIINDSSLEIMSHTKIGLVSAGTITLEAVMMNMYPIITYKVSDFTFHTIKKSENLSDHTLVGLPNVFLKERIFPEILQFEVTPKRLYEEVQYIRNMSPALFEYVMFDAKDRLSDTLGSVDSVYKTAEYIANEIKKS